MNAVYDGTPRVLGGMGYGNNDENPGELIADTCVCCGQPLTQRVQTALLPGKADILDWLCSNSGCEHLYKFSFNGVTYYTDAPAELAKRKQAGGK